MSNGCSVLENENVVSPATPTSPASPPHPGNARRDPIAAGVLASLLGAGPDAIDRFALGVLLPVKPRGWAATAVELAVVLTDELLRRLDK